MHKESDATLLDVIWKYMSYEDPLQPSDAIVVGGCKNTQLAVYASKLYHADLAPVIVFSGHAQSDMSVTEADLLADIARARGVPEHAIIRERHAANTGENITFAAQLLTEKGIKPTSIILIHQPFMSRRFLATAQSQWGSPQPQFITRREPITLTAHIKRMGLQGASSRTLGDFYRMEEYAQRGFQARHDIPAEAKDAFATMLARGHKIR